MIIDARRDKLSHYSLLLERANESVEQHCDTSISLPRHQPVQANRKEHIIMILVLKN